VQPVAPDRDAFWVQKHPELSHGDDVEEYRKVDYDAGGIHMPGQSWYPFFAALAPFIGCYGILYKNWPLAILMGVVLVVATYGWAFEGVGGKHVHPTPRAARGAHD
jgi:cytochrome c oxidase subunit 1